MKDIDVNKLYVFSLDESYEYLKENTIYLDNINKEDIKEIHYSYNKDVYVLLNNGRLYENGNMILDNINTLGFSCGVNMYAFSNDKEVKSLISKDNNSLFINNNDYKYKKIIIDVLKIVGLTFDNKIRVIGTLVDEVIDYEKFYNVDDIGLVDDNIVVIKKNNVYGLFNNIEYKFDDVILYDSNEEYIIL